MSTASLALVAIVGYILTIALGGYVSYERTGRPSIGAALAAVLGLVGVLIACMLTTRERQRAYLGSIR